MRVWAILALACWAVPKLAIGASIETFNGCQGTLNDPCTRSGSCEIQGAQWSQDVTIDRLDIFDTQGWPGLCDMVHVALVQGNCQPAGAVTNVTVYLSQTTSAWIPSIVGPLSCAGEPAPAILSLDDPGSHGEVALGAYEDVIYTIGNDGQSEAAGIVFSGLSGDWSVAGGTCGASLAAGSSCTIAVRFTPSAVGPSADTLLLDYDDGAGPAATVSTGLSGIGVAIEVPGLQGPWVWLLIAGLPGAAAVAGLRVRSRAREGNSP